MFNAQKNVLHHLTSFLKRKTTQQIVLKFTLIIVKLLHNDAIESII